MYYSTVYVEMDTHKGNFFSFFLFLFVATQTRKKRPNTREFDSYNR